MARDLNYPVITPYPKGDEIRYDTENPVMPIIKQDL